MSVADLTAPVVRLDWIGREEATRLAGSPPRAKLRKVPELSTGEGRSGNAIIHADNLSAMAALTPALRGRVDLAFLRVRIVCSSHRIFSLSLLLAAGKRSSQG